MDKDKLKAVMSNNPSLYIDYWLESRGWIYVKSSSWARGKETKRTDHLRKHIHVDYHCDYYEVKKYLKVSDREKKPDYRTPVPYNTMKKELLLDALDVKIQEIEKQKLDEMRLKLRYDPQSGDAHRLISVWVANMTNNEVELATGAMHQFFWQVKRKLNGKKVTHHLMPILVGPQGTGKTENLIRLLGPIAEYKLDLQDALQLTDDRRFPIYETHFVAPMDELAKIGSADFNKIKNFITAVELRPRILGTHDVPSFRQNVTLIGSSNWALNEQIYDSSGMRRFFQLLVDKTISQEVSEGIDYLQIWKSVNENDDTAPIIPYLAQLASHQEKMRTKDAFELFMAEYHVDLTKPLTYKVRVRDGMYKEFKEWAKMTGFDAPVYQREAYIKTHLENRGLKHTPIEGVEYYKVNEDSMFNSVFKESAERLKASEQEIDELESLPTLKAELKKAVANEDYARAATIKRRIKELENNGFLLDFQ